MKWVQTAGRWCCSIFFLMGGNAFAEPPVRVGSKAFTEGYLLGELAAQKIETVAPVARHFGIGGTGLLFQALESGEVDLYPEYTGTLAEAVLKKPTLRDFRGLRAELAAKGFVVTEPLGFNNRYALAVSEEFARARHLRSLGDLARTTGPVRYAISHEFLERADGFRALASAYGLPATNDLQAMEHGLAYEAVRSGQADVIDVYSTDAKIEKFRLVVLEDDRQFFPRYEAVYITRESFVRDHPAAWGAVRSLEGSVTEKRMREMNAQVELDGEVAANVVGRTLNPDFRQIETSLTTKAQLGRRSREHLELVAYALVFSVLFGIPLGLLAGRSAPLRQGILALSGLVQTIPSLALLCLLLPFFGIGKLSAVIALCLYGLLPVVMGTLTGLQGIDPGLVEMARALRLRPFERLWKLQIPLASRSILGGVRTSAIIGIGTATLAALIGAGGFGATIMEGLALNDLQLVLLGAIPAAVLALAAHGLFEIASIVLIPKGLRD